MSCLRPITIRQKGELVTVPCGRCPNCFYNKIAGWTFRLLEEERHSISSQFITLTYDTNHLVCTPYGKASLTKYDLQNFFKRLRKNKCNRGRNIKYYAVGEYGSQTKRPHYHAIIFNAHIDSFQSAWTLDKQLIGDIHYGDVSHASIGYTLKYLNKKSTIGLIGDDDRHPQFSLSSNGLGLSYLSQNILSYHMADLYNRNYLTLPGGQKCPMPRYYYEKIYDGYNRDLLKMSGSLIRQDEFYKNFVTGYFNSPQSLKDEQLRTIRIQAAFDRLYHENQKQLVL
ncbi:MAG: replication initiator protein [Microviridae sp.]|nr:MAG: replication initiator protein [Microviridae sp.]